MPDSESDPVVIHSSNTLLYVGSDSDDEEDSGEVLEVEADRLAPTVIEVCRRGKCLRVYDSIVPRCRPRVLVICRPVRLRIFLEPGTQFL